MSRKAKLGAFAAGGGLVALLGACSSHHTAAAAPTTTVPVTTVPATTTTTRPPPPPVYPLTGLPAPNRTVVRHVAVVVKIDNVDQARPQTGIDNADVVYEEEVEGGLSRLAAVFQSSYPNVVGPVRSGRLTDEGIADDLNYPVYAYSGTNAIFEPILRSQPVTAVDDDNYPNEFYRSGYNSPHNLFANVINLAKLASKPHPPAALFSYLSSGEQFGGLGVAPASGISFSFPAASVNWRYSAASKDWLRDQNGTADVDSSGAQINAANVVVMFVNYIVSGMATGEGLPPAPIPEGILTGSGHVWVMSAGRVVKGTWSRSNLTTTAKYVDAAGTTIKLTPGRTWVELVPVGTVPAVTP